MRGKMPSYRAYWLDKNDRVIAGEDIDAPELSAAIAEVRRVSTNHTRAHPDRFELWVGANRVFRQLDPVVESASQPH
jgi:hypothetical protein